jgi:hypothetical protein
MNVEHIDMQIHPSYQVFFSVKGWEWSACHGHSVKGGGGSLWIPAYGVIRHHNGNVAKSVALAKALSRKDNVTYEELIEAISGIVDHSLVGHFHNKLDMGFVRRDPVTPSLKGRSVCGDVLSDRCLSSSVHVHES